MSLRSKYFGWNNHMIDDNVIDVENCINIF